MLMVRQVDLNVPALSRLVLLQPLQPLLRHVTRLQRRYVSNNLNFAR
jgi:hypothetical protein